MKRCFVYRERERFYRGLKISAWPGIHEEVAEKVGELLPRGSKIADLGAGEGSLALRLIDQGYRVKAFDLAPENFKLEPDLLVQCDLSSPEDTKKVAEEFRGQFDGVVAVEIVEHLTDPWRLVELAREILREKGVLILTTPNIESVFSRLSFLFRAQFPLFPFDEKLLPGTRGPKTGHINPVSSKELLYILRNSGFEVLESAPVGLMPFLYLKGGLEFTRPTSRLT